MTDDEIRGVFAELQRVGSALGQPPGLALGTGFRDGELLGWLRSLPDGLGHQAFVERLNAHVNAAQPNAAAQLPRGPGGRPHRYWPTVEQMHGALDVLVREWDPLGARLGDLPPDDVVHHAFSALRLVLGAEEPEAIERLISAMLGSVEREVFGVRPSPAEQRRYLARRIIQVVVDSPGAPHDQDPFEAISRAARASVEIARAEGRVTEARRGTRTYSTVTFGPRPVDLAPLAPEAACSECGTIGTVAVVEREVEPLVSRYCPACWSAVRDRYLTRGWTTREQPDDARTPEEMIRALDALAEELRFAASDRMRYAASALWEDRLPLVQASLASDDAVSPAKREQSRRRLARDLVVMAPHMYGPMPPELETFVRQYAPAGA